MLKKLAYLKKFIPTNWQQIVGWMAVAAVSTALNWAFKSPDNPQPVPGPGPIPEPVYPDGWLEPSEQDVAKTLAMLPTPIFADTEAGKEEAEQVETYLWKYAIKQRGAHIPTRDQGPVGSCVSFGFAVAVEYCMAVKAGRKIGPPQETIDAAQEVIYAGSRVEANGGIAPILGDGSTGAWAARWLTKGGVLARGKYGDIDLTKYDAARCRAWGRRGVPDALEPIARQNLVLGFALVRTGDEARKAILNGYPVAVCSNVGFAGTLGQKPTRDKDGFLEARGSWAHCMCFIGYRSPATGREGLYCMNSWGENWVAGPLGVGDPPPGGFWVEMPTVDRMMRQGDSYAISDVGGFPRRKLAPDDWIKIESPSKTLVNKGVDCGQVCVRDLVGIRRRRDFGGAAIAV